MTGLDFAVMVSVLVVSALIITPWLGYICIKYWDWCYKIMTKRDK